MRIRYSYLPVKKGISLAKVKCPICGSNHINWVKVAQDTSWNGRLKLLAECYTPCEDKAKHLFMIRIESETLPTVVIKKVGDKKRGSSKKRYTNSEAKA